MQILNKLLKKCKKCWSSVFFSSLCFPNKDKFSTKSSFVAKKKKRTVWNWKCNKIRKSRPLKSDIIRSVNTKWTQRHRSRVVQVPLTTAALCFSWPAVSSRSDEHVGHGPACIPLQLIRDGSESTARVRRTLLWTSALITAIYSSFRQPVWLKHTLMLALNRFVLIAKLCVPVSFYLTWTVNKTLQNTD